MQPTLADVLKQYQDEIVVVGRICLDGLDGKLNASSALLEGSRETSEGKRVSLNLSDVHYSIFPGQIIAAKGHNLDGYSFAPNVIFTGQAKKQARSSAQDFRDHYFTTADGLDTQVCKLL